MKKLMIGLILLGWVGSTFAIDKAELDKRIYSITSKFNAMQQKSDKRIPADTLRRAKGIILLPRTKAGFIFAFQGGSGVALARDLQSGNWSPVAFVGAKEASLGFQVGGQESFIVILLMTTNSTRYLTEPNFEFAGEARGTAGEESSGVEGKVTSTEQPVLVYDDRKGLFGGAAIKGGAISPDEEANRVYYGESLAMKDILFDHKVKPTAASSDLVKKLNQYSAK